jgi:DnaJ-class molecular chaperone
MTTTTDEMVSCPVCKGRKTNGPETGPCLCCKGQGNITKARDTILAMIRKDLMRRIIAMGYRVT